MMYDVHVHVCDQESRTSTCTFSGVHRSNGKLLTLPLRDGKVVEALNLFKSMALSEL